MENNARRWMTVEQAAEYLAVVPYSIRNAVWSGELSAAKLGKRLVFDRTDLDRWAESKKERAA
jgi:excisionase family DNA binding protein